MTRKKSVSQNGADKTKSDRPQRMDDIMQKINPIGRYQILMCFIYSYAYFPLDINNLFMGYGGIKPKWFCSNTTSSNHSEPTKSCSVYDNCDKENLHFVTDFHSIVSEWHLVCDRDYLMNMITSIQMVGLLVGASFAGPITDLYGRKWTFFCILTLELVLGSLSSLAPNEKVFAAFRFFIGFCTGAEMVVGWVFVAESTVNRYRLLIRSIGGVFLPMWDQVLVAYLTKHWKWYSVFGNVQALPLLPILALFTHESPRWLAQSGRVDQARDVLKKIARFNKTEHQLPEKINLETDGSQPRKRYVWDLFRTRRLAVYSLASVGIWFSVSFAHYGMYFDIGNLPTNVYINGAMLAGIGMLNLPIAFFDAYSPKLNRKFLLAAWFTVTGVCSAAVALFQTVIPAGAVSNALLSTSSILGQVATELCFQVAYVYSIELFPTLLRTNAGALCSVGARIAGIIAPQLLLASKSWQPLPYVCFAVVSVLGALVVGLFLPNTKNMHLPETYGESNRRPIENSMTEKQNDDCPEGGVDNEAVWMSDSDVSLGEEPKKECNGSDVVVMKY